VFNASFNNISVITWRLVLLVDETRVPAENYRPLASHWFGELDKQSCGNIRQTDDSDESKWNESWQITYTKVSFSPHHLNCMFVTSCWDRFEDTKEVISHTSKKIRSILLIVKLTSCWYIHPKHLYFNFVCWCLLLKDVFQYDSLRKSLFSNLNINSDYCDTNHVHVDRTLSTLRRLLNPIGIQETKTICHFIQSAFSIHCR
jgi:hypothetical protein